MAAAAWLSSFSRMQSGSLHLAVVKTMMWLLFRTEPPWLRERARAQIEEEADYAADPDDRVLYARLVAGGWVVLGLLCGLAMVGLAFVGEMLAGHSGQTVGLTAGIGTAFFCIAGALYATSRMLWAYRLPALARRHGPASPEIARAARRATPRNTSLVGQIAVAALASALAAGA
jgi:hypothetical protein